MNGTKTMIGASSSMQFHQALNDWGREQFEYGSRDCCQFVSFIVHKMTGKNYAKEFLYGSESSAYEIVEKHTDLVGLFTHLLGEKNCAEVDGDPCIVEIEGIGQVAGVKYKEGVICLLKKGFASVSGELIIASWKLCRQ